MLKVSNLKAGYGEICALFGIDLFVGESEAVSLVGSNGAGKTTLLRAISGIINPTEGIVEWMGKDITHMPSHQRVVEGIIQIPQGRGILATMTVDENFNLAAFIKRNRQMRKQIFEETIELFPVLKNRLNQIAGTLSGGEQQMLAIARSLMLRPKLMIMDEPSLGLAPKLVDEVFEIIRKVKKNGISILLIEQNLVKALGVTDRGYVMETGRIVLSDTSTSLMKNKEVRRAYLGI